jgi:glycosyltransferase involved in cell wall biosynthesis
VLVPLYQCGPWIAAALDSVLAQTFLDFEVVVVDDGSTDGGGEIARAYADRDTRVRYVQQENTGLPGARNTGLAIARGEFVAFLDADDLWLPDKLERQIAVIGEGVLYGDAYLMYDDGEPTSERISTNVPPARGDIFDVLLGQNVVPVLTAIVRRELLNHFSGFDVEQRQVEDWDLWLRMSAAGVPFDYLSEPVSVYRVRTTAMTANQIAQSVYRLRALRKLRRSIDRPRRRAVHRRVRRERALLAGQLRLRAWEQAAAGNVREARVDIDAAFRAEPTSAKALLAAATARVPPLLRVVARREVAQSLR